ncbi:IF44L protein, partial [Polypterus senegalus]|nr:IF44L protein [Polypterus senegalus]
MTAVLPSVTTTSRFDQEVIFLDDDGNLSLDVLCETLIYQPTSEQQESENDIEVIEDKEDQKDESAFEQVVSSPAGDNTDCRIFHNMIEIVGEPVTEVQVSEHTPTNSNSAASPESPSAVPDVINPEARIRDELLKNIRTYKTVTESVEKPRILLIGQIGAGKSSFFNSVNSVFRGHVMLQATAGYGATSLSQQVIHDGKGGNLLPYILCDTMGLEGSGIDEGILVEDIFSVIKGHVHDSYEFNIRAPITRNDRRYRVEPSLADKVHCVVYVVEANKISLLGQNLLKKVKSIRAEVNKMGILQLVLVTKINEACPEVKKDVTKVYRSRYLYEKVTQLGQILGIPVSSISLVKSYSTETELNLHMDILILTALQQMLRAADAYFDDINHKALAQSSSL